MSEFWKKMSNPARFSLVGGLLFIISLTVISAVAFLKTDYQVLFSNPQDANAMVSELERQKIPYKLGADGTSILVDKETVHKTRIKLMATDLPIHGNVGFELFNNSDFGMTEFAQKINYQRAMQGEITRTILSLSEIESARVHLAFPEEGLFKKNLSKTKAAISLVLKKGAVLRPEQVSGIQRLVSAAVPSIQQQDVTIVDQHGIALTRNTQDDTGGELNSSRLDLKKETELYLSKKADAVLNKIFGNGGALTSVDVSLNMDRIKVTTEDVVGLPSKNGQSQTGVVIREKEISHDTSPPLDIKNIEMMGGRSGSSLNRETEYQVGHRVEQIVSLPGAISKLNVLAVVSQPIDSSQQEQIRQLISAAVGASQERGDVIVVQVQTLKSADINVEELPVAAESDNQPKTLNTNIELNPNQIAITLSLMILMLIIGIFISRKLFAPQIVKTSLSESEREAALKKIDEWLSHKTPSSNSLKG